MLVWASLSPRVCVLPSMNLSLCQGAGAVVPGTSPNISGVRRLDVERLAGWQTFRAARCDGVDVLAVPRGLRLNPCRAP